MYLYKSPSLKIFISLFSKLLNICLKKIFSFDRDVNNSLLYSFKDFSY